MGAAGSGAPRKGDYRLPGAAEETGAKGRQTASGAWAGTAHCWNEGRRLLAVRPGTVPQAQSVAVWAAALTRNKLTLSAPAAGTAAPCLPGTLLAGFFPAEVWRNSRQVLTRRSRTAEWRGGTLLPEPAEEEESRPGTTQHRRCVRRRTARTALRLPAGFLPSHCTDGMRGCTLRPRTPPLS